MARRRRASPRPLRRSMRPRGARRGAHRGRGASNRAQRSAGETCGCLAGGARGRHRGVAQHRPRAAGRTGEAADPANGATPGGVAGCAAALHTAALRPPQRAKSAARCPLTKLEMNLTGGCGPHVRAAGHCGRPILKSAAALVAEIERRASVLSAARRSLRKLAKTRAGGAAAVSILAVPQSAAAGAPDAPKAPRAVAWRRPRGAPCAGRRLPSSKRGAPGAWPLRWRRRPHTRWARAPRQPMSQLTARGCVTRPRRASPLSEALRPQSWQGGPREARPRPCSRRPLRPRPGVKSRTGNPWPRAATWRPSLFIAVCPSLWPPDGAATAGEHGRPLAWRLRG